MLAEFRGKPTLAATAVGIYYSKTIFGTVKKPVLSGEKAPF